MKNKLALILFIFFNTIASGQTDLDALLKIWEDKKQPDSARIVAYRDYIWDGYLYSKPDSALILADRLYNFSVEKENKRGAATVLNMQGFTHFLQGNYLQALNHHQRSLALREEIGDKRGIAGSLNNIGLIYVERNNYTKALDKYSKSLKIKEEIGDKRGIAVTLNNIGSIYYNQKIYGKALECYKRSLEIKKEFGDNRGIAVSLINIGQIYFHQGDEANALDYYNRSLSITEEIDDKRVMAQALENIGDIYFNQGDFVNTLDFNRRSLKLRQEIGDKDGVAGSLNSIGLTYHRHGNYRQAVKYCSEALNLAEKIGAIAEQKESCECLFETYKTLDKSSRALAYHEQMLVLSDSLKSEETSIKLQQMEFDKEVLADSLLQVEKSMKVVMKHREVSRKKDYNKNIAITAGIFFLILSAGLFSRWRYVNNSKAVIEKEKDRSDSLLLNILPAEIAEELKAKGSAAARDFDMVSILFTDFESFTETSEKLTANELIEEINHCFEAFDHICEKFRIEKIKTIGDAYMAAGGLPIPSDDAIKNTILAALEMQTFISKRIIEKQAKNEIPFEMRLGIHTGPVVAGIVGVKKFQYDVWGDTVNTASRIESNGTIGKVNISEITYNLIKDDSDFIFESRGKIEAKGKGKIEMYFVTKAK